MKTIGALGGLGPQATMDFEARLHRESQRRIPPRKSGGYLPMVVHYYRSPPFILGEKGPPRSIPHSPGGAITLTWRRSVASLWSTGELVGFFG